MRFIKSKKGLALLVTLVVVAASAIGAYAYFSSTGNGTGSATVGNAGTWTVGQTGTSGPSLYPDAAIGGANVQTEDYHVMNAGSGSQNLSQVVISVATSTGGTWTFCKTGTDTSGTCVGGTGVGAGQPDCNASDFSVGGVAVGTAWTDTSLHGDFTAGQDKTTGTVTVELIDNGANQDNCQGVAVPLYFSAS